MKNAVIAPLLSGLVLPGLGQIINRQPVKGLVLIGLTTVILLIVLVKVFWDLAVVMGQVMGTSFSLGPEQGLEVLAGMRTRSGGFLLVFAAIFIIIWGFGVADAFLTGRRIQTQAGE